MPNPRQWWDYWWGNDGYTRESSAEVRRFLLLDRRRSFLKRWFGWIPWLAIGMFVLALLTYLKLK